MPRNTIDRVGEHACPGAFKALVAKANNGRARVEYVGKHDAPSFVAAARENLTEWLAIVNGTWAPKL